MTKSERNSEVNKINDESGDRKYFTIVPRLVWALSRSPYDFTLWAVIKDIAGESGECYLSTEDLAELSMMSVGKVSECRRYLMKVGLIRGELRKDPGYPQPVWHLAVPDIWAANIEWCEQHPGIADRLEQKKSLHVVKASLGEGGTTPHEAKKNYEIEPSQERKPENTGFASAEVPSSSSIPESITRENLISMGKGLFTRLTKIDPPGGKEEIRLWDRPIEAIGKLAGGDEREAALLITQAVKRARDQRLTIASPRSIQSLAIAIQAEKDRGDFGKPALRPGEPRPTGVIMMNPEGLA